MPSKSNKIILVRVSVLSTLRRIAAYSLLLNTILLFLLVWGGEKVYQDVKVAKVVEQSLRDQRDMALSEVRHEHSLTEKAIKYIHHVDPSIPTEKATALATMNNKVAKALQVSPDIGLALMTQESHMNCGAISHNHTSYGCLQINLTAHKKEYRINKRKLLDMNYNLATGYLLFKKLRDKYGSNEKAFEHYYGSTSDAENKEYARSVMKHLQSIQQNI